MIFTQSNQVTPTSITIQKRTRDGGGLSNYQQSHRRAGMAASRWNRRQRNDTSASWPAWMAFNQTNSPAYSKDIRDPSPSPPDCITNATRLLVAWLRRYSKVRSANGFDESPITQWLEAVKITPTSVAWCVMTAGTPAVDDAAVRCTSMCAVCLDLRRQGKTDTALSPMISLITRQSAAP